MIEQLYNALYHFPVFHWLPELFIGVLAFCLYYIPLFVMCLLIFSIIFYFQNRQLNQGKKQRAISIYNIQNEVQLFSKTYKNLFTSIRNRQLSNIKKRISFLYTFLFLLNISTLLMMPFNQRLQGFQSNSGIPVFLGVFLLNIAGFLFTYLFTNDVKGINSIFKHTFVLFNSFLVFSIAFISITLSINSYDIKDVILDQSGYFLRIIPKWNVFSIPFTSVHAVVSFLYCLIIFQIFNQYNRPIPIDYSNIYRESPGNISNIIHEFWKYSFLTVLSAFLIILFLGGYLSPIQNAGLPGSPFVDLGWFLLKIGIFWMMIFYVNRSIPHFIEDQILRLTYKYAIPIQFVSLIFLLIIHNFF